MLHKNKKAEVGGLLKFKRDKYLKFLLTVILTWTVSRVFIKKVAKVKKVMIAFIPRFFTKRINLILKMPKLKN